MQARDAKSVELDSGAVSVALGAGRKRVLFVDDEPAILEGLRAVLRPQRREWEMVFALGGPEGLSAIESSCFDVVVTDMRMPVIDGAKLLTRVKELQPRAVRLVLSGQTDGQTALKTVFTAHQFLAKPCDPEKLRSVVQRCCSLNQLLADEELRSLAGDVSLLPAAPKTYLAISQALANPNTTLADVAGIIERDPTLCAKVLQVANSAFFGLPRAVSSVTQAATYLGTLALRDLALAMESMAALEQGKPSLAAATYLAFQTNSLAVGLLSRRCLRSDRRRADEAFVTGMLRDVGHLLLAMREAPGAGPAPSHAALSAYLLGLWGLPHPVLEAAAFHEQPAAVEHAELEVVDVVHLCDCIVSQQAPSPFQPAPELDRARYAALGIDDARLEELHGSASDVLREAAELLRA